MGGTGSDMSPLNLVLLLVSSTSLAGGQFTTTTTTTASTSCDDFSDGLCPLSEDNIVGSTNSPSVELCQAACRDNSECNFFSYIGSQCFLLSSCATTESCPGCMSGPPLPNISDCQESTTGPPTTTTTMGNPTTTVPPTTIPPTMTTTTTMKPTTTTTMETTTTLAPCDLTEGLLCDEKENLITEIEGISSASDCQAVCQNHPE